MRIIVCHMETLPLYSALWWCPLWGAYARCTVAASGCGETAQGDQTYKRCDGSIQYTPQLLKRTPSRPDMGIIVSCLTEIVVCLGECIMGIFGAIADCLGCVIAGTPYISASCHP